MDLKGKTILITGGTSGIGLAFADAFYKMGAKVIVCGRRKERLEKLQTSLPGIITKAADISKERDRMELAEWTIHEHPDVSVLINNAGVQLLLDLTKPVDLSRVHQEIETNLVAPLHLASLLTPHLKEKAEAAIINISSGLAFVPIAMMPLYCATKAGIHSYTLSLRHQLRNSNIKVFEIAPPAVDTELGSDRREDKTQTHGGMPVSEFVTEALDAIKNDIMEAAVGMAKGLREKREDLLDQINSRFH